MKNSSLSPVRVAYADDHILVREGICNLINTIPGFSVEVQADNGEDLLQHLDSSSGPINLCLLDINMPVRNGWATLPELRRRYPEMGVIVVSTLGEDTVVSNVIRAGAHGFVCKSCTRDLLKEALYTVSGGAYFFPMKFSYWSHRINTPEHNEDLSKREREFLEQCCDDVGYKEIAARMHVSTRTVEGYRDSVFEKLNIKTRVGLVLYALKNGFGSFFNNRGR
jgi:two-component system, NarL family, invasion response regulator UvrY